MKSLIFRPLRFNKKLNKIIVASYSSWYKIKCANYYEFNLVVDDEYKNMPKNEFVYNHKGEQIFFYDIKPWDIPIITPIECNSFLEMFKKFATFGYRTGSGICYCGKGVDCNGTPTFNHYTPDYIATHYFETIDNFEPLTVEKVNEWLGWFLYQLDKSNLTVGK